MAETSTDDSEFVRQTLTISSRIQRASMPCAMMYALAALWPTPARKLEVTPAISVS